MLTSPEETLDVGNLLEQPDQFEIASREDTESQKVHFTAQTKGKRILIEIPDARPPVDLVASQRFL